MEFVVAMAVEKLKEAGLRPTRQRIGLTQLLYAEGHRHVTAEQLHQEAVNAGISVSLATVYNTLNQFTRVGLLGEVVIAPGQTYFDTNNDHHHHLYHIGSGRMEDIHGHDIQVTGLPPIPAGTTVKAIQVVVRVDDEVRSN